MEHLERIRKMMDEAGLDSIDFMYHRNHPVITRDYRRHEIYTIYKPEDGEDELTLATITYSPYGTCTLKIDARTRKPTWRMLERIVEKELSKRGCHLY